MKEPIETGSLKTDQSRQLNTIIMTTSIIRFLNIIAAALLAGTSFGIWIGFNPLNLSPSTYIEQ